MLAPTVSVRLPFFGFLVNFFLKCLCKYFYKSQKSATDNSAGTFLALSKKMSVSTDRSQKRSKNFFWIKGEILIRATFQAAITWSVVALPEPKSVKKKTTGTWFLGVFSEICEKSVKKRPFLGVFSKICEKSVKKSVKIWKNPSDHWPAYPWSKKSVISVTDFFDHVTKSSDQVTKSCDQGQNHLKHWSNSSGQRRFLLLPISIDKIFTKSGRVELIFMHKQFD